MKKNYFIIKTENGEVVESYPYSLEAWQEVLEEASIETGTSIEDLLMDEYLWFSNKYGAPTSYSVVEVSVENNQVVSMTPVNGNELYKKGGRQ